MSGSYTDSLSWSFNGWILCSCNMKGRQQINIILWSTNLVLFQVPIWNDNIVNICLLITNLILPQQTQLSFSFYTIYRHSIINTWSLCQKLRMNDNLTPLTTTRTFLGVIIEHPVYRNDHHFIMTVVHQFNLQYGFPSMILY